MVELPQAPPDGAGPPPARAAVLAALLIGWCLAWYLAYGWAAMVRLDWHDDLAGVLRGVTLLGALLGLGFLRPFAATSLLLLVIPLSGNHPGGRLMEIINLPLAASAAGFAFRAYRQARTPPRGAIWSAAALYAAAALVAVVPTIGDLMVQVAALNDWPIAIAEGLTAPADNPLYVLSSVAGVTLCVAWSAACHWCAPPPLFYRAAARVLIYPFFIVVGLGMLNHFGIVDLVTSYQLRIDPRPPDVSGFQSIFWNPGWYAWYFVMSFALAVGFLWSAAARERYVLAGLLACAYAFSFLNPQRGGLIALHICLAAAGVVFVRTSARRRMAVRAVALSCVALLTVVIAAYAFELIPRAIGSSLYRLIESPAEVATSNSVRLTLWTVALEMWRDAPLFGIGEGSFAWRFEDYAPAGTPRYTVVHGDAHSTWLQILATRGLFGVAALLALLVAMGATLRQGSNGPGPAHGMLTGASLSLAGFLVYSVVQGMFYLQGIQVFFWFLVTTVAAVQPPVRGARGPSRSRLAVAALVLAAVGVQAWTALPRFARARAVIDREPRGFYGLEEGESGRAWRWSAGREGTLCVQPLEPSLEVQLAAGDPRPEEYPRTVVLKVNGVDVDTFTLEGPGEVRRAVAVPRAPATPQAPAFGECVGEHDVRLTVSVDRTWNPMDDGLGADPRTLGVRVYQPSGRPVASSP